MNDMIFALDQAWEESIIAEDADALQRLAHEDLVYTHSSCEIDDKAAFVSHIMDGPLDFLTVLWDDVNISVHGDMALLTCALHKTYAVKGTERGGELHFRATKVWINEDGRWQLIANQSTKIPQGD